MTQYIKDDNIIRVSGSSTLEVSRKLPCGTYLLEKDERTGQYYLRRIEDFRPSGKIYGEHQRITDRVINTFMSRANHNLGVLLSGVKGSGPLRASVSRPCTERIPWKKSTHILERIAKLGKIPSIFIKRISKAKFATNSKKRI